MKNKIYISIALLLTYVSSMAQTDELVEEAVEKTESIFNFPILTEIVLLTILVIALLILSKILIRYRAVNLYDEYGLDAFLDMRETSWLDGINRVLSSAVPVEAEADIQLDHDYDGIKELDNDLPPWWTSLFYLTIVIGVAYFSYYHVFNLGLNQLEQYDQEMATAKVEIEAYLASQADLVDETNVIALTDMASIDEGREIFTTYCVACHLASGGGSVGPNLTDEYWLHGGGIKDIFTTVKYGVPEKGMIAWQAQMGAADIHKVSSYILTLAGTNPADGKEPQGELYSAEGNSSEADNDLESENENPIDSVKVLQ